MCVWALIVCLQLHLQLFSKFCYDSEKINMYGAIWKFLPSFVSSLSIKGLGVLGLALIGVVVIPIPGAIMANLLGVTGRNEARTAVRSLEDLDKAFKSDRVSFVQYGGRWDGTWYHVSRACAELPKDSEICDGLRKVLVSYGVPKGGWETRSIPEETYRQLTYIKGKLGQ